MTELTKEEYATYTWRPSQAEVTRSVKRRLAQAEIARTRIDLEDYPGEAEDVYNRLLADAIGFASK
jgi:hypothetical protein